MHNIVIFGDGGKRILTKVIVGACRKYGGVIVIDDKKIYETDSDPDFMVISTNDIRRIDCSGVFVMGSSFCQNYPEVNMNNMMIVADSNNNAALPFLKKLNGTVIGCSMSPCDTVSLSCNDDCRVVSIRRCITTLDASLIEPCEICVNAEKEIPVYPLLAACCVLLVFGIDFDKGYTITI